MPSPSRSERSSSWLVLPAAKLRAETPHCAWRSRVRSPQRGRGPVKRIAGQNSAFKRDVLLRYENQLELMLSADLVLQWKMAQEGNQLFYEPAASMAHRNENTMRSLCVGVFYWNWCFKHPGPSSSGFPRRHLNRAAPLIPVRLARMFVSAAARPSQLAQLVRDIPLVRSITQRRQVAGLLNPVDTGVREFRTRNETAVL